MQLILNKCIIDYYYYSIMTWLLIFTGFLASIMDQGNTPYCTAYATATCASVYGVKEDPIKIAKNELWLIDRWYGERLVNLKRFNISPYYQAQFEVIKEKLNHWPILVFMPIGTKMNNEPLKENHHGCLAGYNSKLIVANSWGTSKGYSWYFEVEYSTWLMFQDFWTGDLLPKKIIIDGKNWKTSYSKGSDAMRNNKSKPIRFIKKWTCLLAWCNGSGSKKTIIKG